MADNNTTATTPQQLAEAYAKVAMLEESISDAQGRIRSRLNQLEAERAYLQRRAQDLERQAVQSIELLRNEQQVAEKMKKPAPDGSGQSELEVFVEHTSSLLEQVSEQLDKSD